MWKRAIDRTNQPHLYCVETCPNTIYALEEWSGKTGNTARKDPIDCLRMFTLSGSEHIDPALLQPIHALDKAVSDDNQRS